MRGAEPPQGTRAISDHPRNGNGAVVHFPDGPVLFEFGFVFGSDTLIFHTAARLSACWACIVCIPEPEVGHGEYPQLTLRLVSFQRMPAASTLDSRFPCFDFRFPLQLSRFYSRMRRALK